MDRTDCTATTAGSASREVAAAETSVLTLAVLADDDPVQFVVVGLAQRAGDAGQEADRADVGPLVEALADLQPQAPQADVVRGGGPADGAEADGAEALELVQTAVGHHLPGGGVAVAVPGELLANLPSGSQASVPRSPAATVTRSASRDASASHADLLLTRATETCP
ncbi:hypothetical protein GCM10010365_20930 [Streptomyces poonensis]|uniref:Uncharacterized protein n=1 Tax=Streptomyces poonensis TaxID=68255 RepID=A0A918PER1_9ACTN|nr:hypothetical protein GCM10010365_20930 [Streptomyces poonensis]